MLHIQTVPFLSFPSFFSGLHCDAVWPNSRWHFHSGLQLPDVCRAGLCHSALQLWWQNCMWIIRRATLVVCSHLNQVCQMQTLTSTHVLGPPSARLLMGTDNKWCFIKCGCRSVDAILACVIQSRGQKRNWACYYLIFCESDMFATWKDSTDWRLLGLLRGWQGQHLDDGAF